MEKFDRKVWRLSSLVMMGINMLAVVSIAMQFNMLSRVHLVSGLLGVMGGCILAILSLAYSFDRAPKTRKSYVLLGLLWLVFAGNVADNFSRILPEEMMASMLNTGLCYLSYFAIVFILPVFFSYQRSIFEVNESEKNIREEMILLSIAAFVFLVLGFLFDWIFTLDENGIFEAHWGHSVAMVPPILGTLLCIVDNLRLPIEPRKRFALFLFNITPLLGIGAAYVSQIAFLYPAASFALLLIYLTVQLVRSLEMVEQEKTIAEQRLDLNKQQTRIMMSQMQPHFIYNTLASIYYLCGKDVKLAQKTILDFSDYIRTNMESLETNPMVSFEKELEHTKIYLAIEKLRFSDILNVEYDIVDSDFLIPALSLQPLVENAVKYGVRSRETGGTVTIHAHRDGKRIVVSVHDDGIGFDVNAIGSDGRIHFGIANTRKRLEMMCAGTLTIDSSAEKGTTVTMQWEENE